MDTMVDSRSPGTRLEQARQAATALVNAMELEDAPIDRCLMLAQRTARLMRDEDAQRWLDLETRGYTSTFQASTIGYCGKYVYRFDKNGQISFLNSLPDLETRKKSAEVILNKIQIPALGVAENFTVANATKELMKTAVQHLDAARQGFAASSTAYTTMRSALHQWATDTLIALELGEAAEDIFQTARKKVDAFIRAHAPKAAEQLVGMAERMREESAESYSHALVSCRRLIASIADAVFPARAEPHQDSKGKIRKVGEEQYKNRLLAYIEERSDGNSTAAILTSELEHLSARLDAIYEKTNKGVHTDVSIDEARLVVISTYIFLAEVARLEVNNPDKLSRA